MFKQYPTENTNETYLRIWQKVTFGKQILKPDFFEKSEIPDSDNSYRLTVYQYNPNTRLFFLEGNLYWVTSNEAVYNYLDTGRAVTVKSKKRCLVIGSCRGNTRIYVRP